MSHLKMTSCLAIAVATVLAATHSASAQAVQLPTISQFSVGTTVSVPVGGRMHLGSIRRARESRVSRGVPGLGGPLFGSRGIGREMSVSGVDVGVQLHDMAELDRQTLAAARQSSPSVAEYQRQQDLRLAVWLSHNMGRGAPAAPLAHVQASRPVNGGRQAAERPCD